MKKILFTALILSSFFVGCKKKEDKPATAQTRTQLLTANNWLMTAFTVNPPIAAGGTQISDLFAQMGNCSKDDLTKFNTNLTVLYDEGATKCDPSDPQTTNGIWSFNTDETIITVDGDSQKIETLNATQLKISSTEVEDGISYTFTTTYSKK